MDELLLQEQRAGADGNNQQLLYMHEEVKTNTQRYLMNYSLSASSDTPLHQVVTASDLLSDNDGPENNSYLGVEQRSRHMSRVSYDTPSQKDVT